MTTGEEKRFPFRVVLSAVTGLNICPDVELFQLYQHMVGSVIFDRQLPVAAACCKHILLNMCPDIKRAFDLKQVIKDVEIAGQDSGVLAEYGKMELCLAEAQVKFGADEIIIPAGCAANPAQKLQEMHSGGNKDEVTS